MITSTRGSSLTIGIPHISWADVFDESPEASVSALSTYSALNFERASRSAAVKAAISGDDDMVAVKI